mmetsp:Transcript_32902/g.60302  ORF Transcript_32902/g.60302 Transcript_32902/m.60302 type:complete len:249 (+) Transcript_32902:246-992(+)
MMVTIWWCSVIVTPCIIPPTLSLPSATGTPAPMIRTRISGSTTLLTTTTLSTALPTSSPSVGITPLGCTLSTAATIPLLCHQHPPYPLVHRFQLVQTWTGNLHGIPRDREDDYIFPRVQLILVLHHLRSLPVVLDACSLERKLFNFYRDRASGLCFNDSNVVFRLASIHIHHPRLCNNPANHHVFGLPVLRTIWRSRLLCVILHHVLSLSHHHSRLGYVKQKGQGTRSLLDETGCLLGILDINAIHLQ